MHGIFYYMSLSVSQLHELMPPCLCMSITLYMFQLRLRIDDSRYVLYRGPNASAVWQQWVEASQSWLNLMPWKTDTVSLALFNDTCIGVDTLAKYSIQVYIKRKFSFHNYRQVF